MAHIDNADGQGQLLIGDRLSPMTYHVSVEKKDSTLVARVELQAPRDWLIKQGFKRRATLVLGSGDRVEVTHDGQIDVSDSLSIVLKVKDLVYRESENLLEAFPELAARQSGTNKNSIEQ
ncbi:hypothetical protein [Rhizobium glycinendophyticum]|uniref:Uncharacterized protein n=1 Tax=Rhizobium glycinendophyticum TaxID=2589807 RepID=A0A504TWD3_9HYPH|nr:hypothetical protein [Rhizobium glycinendophyticum]TPP07038.1 hypothetical protein FJQ55_15365 [Rhizobium glycinendophyticum]